MKIGILTFHCAHNYGAMLQAFALQQYIKTLGHDVFLIDYRPIYITKQYRRFVLSRWFSYNILRGIRKFSNELMNFYSRCIRYSHFSKFIREYLTLYPYHSSQDLLQFDLILLGSDQIWSKGITGGKNDDLYWGKNIKVPVASYAASARKFSILDESDRQYVIDALSHLVGISVREKSLKEKLSVLTSRSIEQVLDPTLLVEKEVYAPLLQNTFKESKPYVLIYQVVYDKNLGRIAHQIADKLGVNVIEICANTESPQTPDCKRIVTASPVDFVQYIRNARYVITSSFHGTALSIVFERPFYTVKLGTDVDDRAISLLSSLNLENCSLDKTADPITENFVNFSKAHELLDQLRLQSRVYLNHVIEKVGNG